MLCTIPGQALGPVQLLTTPPFFSASTYSSCFSFGGFSFVACMPSQSMHSLLGKPWHKSHLCWLLTQSEGVFPASTAGHWLLPPWLTAVHLCPL